MVYHRSWNRNPDRVRKSHRKCNEDFKPRHQYSLGSLNLQKWYPFSESDVSEELMCDLVAEMRRKKLEIL